MTECTAPRIPASEPLGNQGLQEPKTDLATRPRKLSFEQINEVTVKVTDGRGTNAWTGRKTGESYRTTRAVAWIMAVGNERWVVRYRNKASRPMKLPAAKKYAIEMVKGVRPGRVVDDPIRELNRMAAIVAQYSRRANKEAA